MMAADRGRGLHPLPNQRGRSCSPHMPSKLSPYSPWYPPGRDRSPHFSPDRITRYATPSQRSMDSDQEDIVPRIPQPYRTSFSAITSPQRVPKTPPPSRIHGVAPLTRSAPARSTMPGRITNRYASAPQSSPPKKPPRMFLYTRPSQNSATINGIHDTDTSDYASPEHVANSKPKPPRVCSNSPAAPGELMVDGRINSVTSTVDSVFSDSYVPTSDQNTTFDSLDDQLAPSYDKNPSNPPPNDNNLDVCLREEPEKKLVIEKEYVHVIEVNYAGDTKGKSVKQSSSSSSKPDRSRSFTRRGLNLFRSKRKNKKDKGKVPEKSDSEPASPQFVHRDKHGRSTTLPSEVLSDAQKGTAPPKVKKSLSSSITRLFKRMSPKSYRKPGDGKHEPSSQTSSCSNSLQGEVLIYQNGDLGSVNSNQSGDSTSSVNRTPKTSQDDTSQSSMPSSSARMLKSIGDKLQASNEKSVYRAFKERQSPRTPVEATTLKPQALRAVEFPDTLLQQAADPSSNSPSALSTCNSDCNFSPVVPRLLAHAAAVSSPGSSQVTAKGTDGSRKQDPPQTLNVRDVGKLNKHMFAYPSMSAESIGQCSLDVMGSEPSLASKNGQRSSTTASKRTLASQENITTSSLKSQPQALQTSTPATANDLAHRSSSQSSLPPVETTALPNKDTVDNASPKTPSYLKLSCALGGYSKYNAYASPKAQNRRHVGQNDTLDDDFDSENVIPNGHVEPVTSPVTSNKVTVTEVNKGPSRATVTITPNGATVTRLSNGGVDYPPIQPKPVSYTSQTNSSSDSKSSPSPSPLPVVNGSNASRTPADVGNTSTDSQCNVNGSVADAVSEGVKPIEGFKTPEQSRDSDSDTPTPSKDGKYFMSVVEREEARLASLCHRAEQSLQSNTPEEASGKIRATIGKANLLTTKKFRQFRGLCERNMEQDSDEQFQTTSQDLAGFWDMVLIQVEDVLGMFEDIEKLRQNGWREERTTPVQAKKAIGATPTKTRSSRPKSGATPKSAKSHEAAKAREEARRRLLEAKRAGRERKASQSDKEEVEIYVN